MEFHGNHGDVTSWLEEAEFRLDQLEARATSSEAPLVSPIELLSDAMVCGLRAKFKIVPLCFHF